MDEFADYIIKVLPLIFNGKIPDDILSKHEWGVIPESYYEKIIDFINKIGYEIPREKEDDEESMKFSYWPHYVVNKLEKILGQKRWNLYP